MSHHGIFNWVGTSSESGISFLTNHTVEDDYIIEKTRENIPSFFIFNEPLYFIIHDGMIRSYRLHVPSTYNDTVLTPLVLVLHGGGGRSMTMLKKTEFSSLSEKEGFICVYPNGISRFPFLFRSWNGGYCCGVALEKNSDDVGFIKNLITHISSQFTIDHKRIYVTGHSNGAIMTYRLGSELSSMIAAIAPVAGSIGGQANSETPPYIIPEPRYPVSVVAFHGQLDENVPYNGGQGNRSRGYGSDLSVNESIGFWVTHNKCDPVPEIQVSTSGNIVQDIYRHGLNNTEVQLYTIVNGGHGWPGSDTGDRPTKEISATELIWDFFKEHPKK
jgi:polyhydroxybutyrate depolymerase